MSLNDASQECIRAWEDLEVLHKERLGYVGAPLSRAQGEDWLRRLDKAQVRLKEAELKHLRLLTS
jgi:hypothetical protein